MNPTEENPIDFDGPSSGRGSDLLAGLNPSQIEAITHGDGPLLVLAGAGSGKTRVITHRIAFLMRHRGVSPYGIVAVTFTNKAAAEMRVRVEALIGPERGGSSIGTFHAMCLRLLRREAAHAGLPPTFVIYDTDDQTAVVKRILKEEGEESLKPRTVRSRISAAKNAMIFPEEYAKQAFSPEYQMTALVYKRYEEALAQAGAVDFDDLLVRTVQLFDDRPEIAERYAQRCLHLLVDEYQDTNRPQYRLIRHLARIHGNICVVGDEDQSIYRFRGAEIKNILDFERDHPGTRTIRLEQNYRSSGAIIAASSAVIAHNIYRKGKTLWTDNSRGERLELFQAPDDRLEAKWVAQRVNALVPGLPFEDIAVLYRTNAQSRLLEEIFRRDRIPYTVVGSVQFYARKEIKDLLSYVKLAANPEDSVAFRRVVNTPPRGIGATTLRSLDEVARDSGISLLAAARQALDRRLLSSRPARMLGSFVAFIDELSERAGRMGVAELLESTIERIDYAAHLEKTYAGMAADRMDNVRALVSAAVEYAEEDEDESLQGFLDRSALVAQADEVGQRPGVTLMTIHCAKGLEFPAVFLVGLEENIFPHAMSLGGDEQDVEEERRLCYVAMTRAKQRLFLTHAQFRRSQGALLPNPPSRFLREIPRELIQRISAADAGLFESWDLRESGRDSGRYTGSSAARAARPRPAPAKVPDPPRVPAEVPDDGFAVGATVKHPSFGGGRILDREGAGKHLKLTIHFTQHGAKKILPAYTQLQVQVG